MMTTNSGKHGYGILTDPAQWVMAMGGTAGVGARGAGLVHLHRCAGSPGPLPIPCPAGDRGPAAGASAIRVLALPAVFLLFAVPLPAPLLNYLVFPLQIATADITGWFLNGIGFPVYVLGDRSWGPRKTSS